MDALYHTPYTTKLMGAVSKLKSDRGWYAGLYEKSKKIDKAVTCNTNAIVLESLLYKKEGPIFTMIKTY